MEGPSLRIRGSARLEGNPELEGESVRHRFTAVGSYTLKNRFQRDAISLPANSQEVEKYLRNVIGRHMISLYLTSTEEMVELNSKTW